MRWTLVATIALGLAGCASPGMDKAECRVADWRAIGYEDGARGAGADAFGQRRKACAGHGVTADFDAYLAGHGQGLELFCRPQNASRLGASGYRYSGVCPAELEGPFLEAHAESYGLYERQAAVDHLGRQLAALRARSQEIEHLLVQKGALLLAPHILPAERANLAVQLKQLGEEKIAIKDSIPRVELELVEAEQERDRYRIQIAQNGPN